MPAKFYKLKCEGTGLNYLKAACDREYQGRNDVLFTGGAAADGDIGDVGEVDNEQQENMNKIGKHEPEHSVRLQFPKTWLLQLPPQQPNLWFSEYAYTTDSVD